MNQDNPEKRCPKNREQAFAWGIHEEAVHLHQFSFMPDRMREQSFLYQLDILQAKIDAYRATLPAPATEQPPRGQPVVTTCAICEGEHQIERIGGEEGWDDYYCPIANETFTHMHGTFTHIHGAEQEASDDT